jgi:hypothetical protein
MLVEIIRIMLSLIISVHFFLRFSLFLLKATAGGAKTFYNVGVVVVSSIFLRSVEMFTARKLS